MPSMHLAENWWAPVQDSPWASSHCTRHTGRGGSERLWEELLVKFVQIRLTNERELQISTAIVDIGTYWQHETLLVAQRWLSSQSSQQRGQHVFYWKTAVSFAQS